MPRGVNLDKCGFMSKIYVITIATIVVLITGCIKTHDMKNEAYLVSEIEYICEKGKKLHVTYFTTVKDIHRALIKFDGTKYDLENVISGSGAKYSDGTYTWWTKGCSGFFVSEGLITVRDCVSSRENGNDR